MISLIKIAFKNVQLHWRHSLASLLSILVAIISLNFFQGYLTDIENLYYTQYRFHGMYGDLVVVQKDAESAKGRAEPWTVPITEEMQTELVQFVAKNSDLIVKSARFLTLQGLISNGSTSAVFNGLAYDEHEAAELRGPLWKWNTLYGEPGYLKVNTRNTIQIGQSLGRTMGCRPVAKVRAMQSEGGYKAENRPFACENSSMQLSATTDSGQLNALNADVTGLLDAGFLELDRRYVAMDLNDAQTLINTKRITYMSLLLDSPSSANEVISRFQNQVGKKFPDLTVMPWQKHPKIGDPYNRTMEMLTIFRNFVVIVIVAISILSVFNSMTKAMNERIREVGTLMSLGFLKRHIRLLFMSEAVFLSLFGIFMGLIASVAMTLAINSADIYYKAGMLSEPIPLHVTLSLKVALLTTLSMIILTMATTVLALRRVLAKKIIECLHHV